jgi:hypothetical protein
MKQIVAALLYGIFIISAAMSVGAAVAMFAEATVGPLW